MKRITAPADPVLLPRDAETGEPLAPTAQPGYYPGFSTMAQRKFWDDTTRQTVKQRVKDPPPRRFFSESEWNFWATVFEHLLPQTDRTPERRIPLIPSLDERLHEGRTIGYRYESMPDDREVYRIGIDAINAEAQHRFAGNFLDLPYRQRELVMQALHDGKPQAAPEIWAEMLVHRFWQMILGDAIDAYYAHPWAWDEVGFGGPAYPRAYTRLERGEPEPWEVEEQRYEWDPPSQAASHLVESQAHLHLESDQFGHVSGATQPARKK